MLSPVQIIWALACHLSELFRRFFLKLLSLSLSIVMEHSCFFTSVAIRCRSHQCSIHVFASIRFLAVFCGVPSPQKNPNFDFIHNVWCSIQLFVCDNFYIQNFWHLIHFIWSKTIFMHYFRYLTQIFVCNTTFLIQLGRSKSGFLDIYLGLFWFVCTCLELFTTFEHGSQ